MQQPQQRWPYTGLSWCESEVKMSTRRAYKRQQMDMQCLTPAYRKASQDESSQDTLRRSKVTGEEGSPGHNNSRAVCKPGPSPAGQTRGACPTKRKGKVDIGARLPTHVPTNAPVVEGTVPSSRQLRQYMQNRPPTIPWQAGRRPRTQGASAYTGTTQPERHPHSRKGARQSSSGHDGREPTLRVPGETSTQARSLSPYSREGHKTAAEPTPSKSPQGRGSSKVT